MLKVDQLRLRNILTEAIMLLCKNGLSYETEFCIEGLLGITLDKSEIFLVNIKETINKVTAGIGIVEDPDDAILDLVVREHIETAGNDDFLIEDLSLKPSRKSPKHERQGGKTKNDLMDKSRDSNGSLDLSMGDIALGGQCHSGRGGKDDSLNMIVPDMAAAYAKYVDLDPVALLTGDTSRVRDVSDDSLVRDLSMSVSNQVSVFNQDVLQSMIDKDEVMANEESEACTVTAAPQPEIAVKQERFNAIAEDNQGTDTLDLSSNVIVTTESSESLVIDAQVTTTAESLLPSEDQGTAAVVTLEQQESFEMEVDLSLPKDLTVTEKQKKSKPKVSCPQCGKRYKSEQGLKKHKCKAQTEGSSQPHTSETTQPLDLTICRSDDETMDHDPGELDPSDLGFPNSETYSCICSKTLTDYESYADHLASCSKSKLTPYKACDICGKYFFSTSGYVKHKRLHVGAYKFRCNVCHKGFFDRTHLGAHMDSSHSKVRRFECPFCKSSFFWKHHLKRHQGTCYKAKEMKQLKLPVQVPEQNPENKNGLGLDDIAEPLTDETELARQDNVDSGTAEQIEEASLNASLDLTIS